MPDPAPDIALSVVVICHNMARELPRTLVSLSAPVQKGLDPAAYEIIVVDNGSSEPFDAAACRAIAPNIRILHETGGSPSPARAINRGLAAARGAFAGVMIDGARMASPGLLRAALDACRTRPGAAVGSYACHLGPDVQMKSVGAGYDQAAEDALLASVPWQRDGYRLFDISVFAGSSAGGWFSLPSETNALFMSRDRWRAIGGFDEAFQGAGGGLVNLDTWKRACEDSAAPVVMLLGEATFHQVHGGVATNATASPWRRFATEYETIRGTPYARPDRDDVIFHGRLPAPPQQPVYVLGMHRSGTSALTRALNLGGYRLPRNLLGANQDNPHGYWEPEAMVRFNDALLDRLDRHWADPKPLPEGWQHEHEAETGRAAALLEAELDRAGTAGAAPGLVLKDPRFCLTLPLWRAAARLCGADPACLIIHRAPEACFRSLQARDRLPRAHALQLWLRYMLEAEAGSRGLRRAFIGYDALLEDWRPVLRTALDTAGLPGREGLETAAAEIDGFLTGDARHHRAGAVTGEGALEADLRGACDWLGQAPAAQDPEPMDEIRRRDRMRWRAQSPGPDGSGLPQDLPFWHAERAWALARDNRIDEAAAAAARAAELDPDVMRFHFIHGTMLLRAGRFEAAAAALRRALARDDSQARVHRALAQALDGLGDLPGAIAAQTAALARDDRAAADHHALGRLLLRAKRPKEAAAALRRAIARDAGKQPYHLALATALRQGGGRAARAEALAAAARLGPLPADRADELGELQALLGRLPEAVAAFDAGGGARLKLFGLGPGGDRRGPPGPAATRLAPRARLTELTRALARSGAAHWAQDLAVGLPYDRAPGPAEGETPWPGGRHLAPHRPVALQSRVPQDSPRRRLSVMLPVYRVSRGDWLRAALESVLCQLPDPETAEVVVIDDASPDGTAREVAEAFAPQVRYLRNETNLGLIGNQNRCIEEAAGDFVHILHQDDRVEPGFYDALLPALEADPTLVAGMTLTGYIDAGGRLKSREARLQPRGILEHWAVRLTLQIRIQYPSILVRRSAYLAAGGFSPSLAFSFDWDMWNRIAASGPIWFEPEPLAQYRVHEGSATYGFGWLERVQDAMRTVAYMQRLLPAEDRRAIAEFGVYKVFQRYWMLLGTTDPGRESDDQRALRDFLLSGWTTPAGAAEINVLFAGLQAELAAQ